MKNAVVVIILTGMLSVSFTASAETVSKAKDTAEFQFTEETTEEVDIYAIPPILDQKYRHRKKGQIEIMPYGGAYLGNSIGQTWIAGVKTLYNFNNHFGLGATYGISNLMSNRDSTFGRTLTKKIMQVVNAEACIGNDAAFTVGKKVVEMDFYALLGAGAMYINGTWEPAGLIGGGIRVFPGISWLAFRIDVANYAHYTPQPGTDQFDFDVLFLGGISFMFPTNPSPYEMKYEMKRKIKYKKGEI